MSGLIVQTWLSTRAFIFSSPVLVRRQGVLLPVCPVEELEREHDLKAACARSRSRVLGGDAVAGIDPVGVRQLLRGGSAG